MATFIAIIGNGVHVNGPAQFIPVQGLVAGDILKQALLISSGASGLIIGADVAQYFDPVVPNSAQLIQSGLDLTGAVMFCTFERKA